MKTLSPHQPALLALLLLALLLSACQSAPLSSSAPAPASPIATPRPAAALPTLPPAPSPTSTPPPHLQVDPESLRGLQLTFLHPFYADSAAALASLTDEFNQTNVWGLHVKLQAPGSAGLMNQAVADALQDGPLPHILAAESAQLAAWEAAQPTFADLNDYIQDPNWGLAAEERASFFPNFWEGDSAADGTRQLALPALRTARLMVYNQTWAEELGFSAPPTNEKELELQLCAALQANLADTDRANDGTGGWIVDNDPYTILTFLAAFGEDPTQVGDRAYTFNTPANRDAFAYLRGLFDRTCAWNSRQPEPQEYFSTRRTLLYTASLQDLPRQERLQTRLNPNDSWTVLPFPAIAADPLVIASGHSYAVTLAKPEEQLGAWLFIRWLSLPRHQARLAQTAAAWPVSQAALDLMQDYAASHPQWAAAAKWIPQARPAPRSGDWARTQYVLQDAAWQLFQANLSAEQIPDLLTQLDDTIPDVLQPTP